MTIRPYSSATRFRDEDIRVRGEVFQEGAECPAHDIDFDSTPVPDLADAKTTKKITDLRLTYDGNPKELCKHLEARHDTDLQKARDSVRNTHPESVRQCSQTVYRFQICC